MKNILRVSMCSFMIFFAEYITGYAMESDDFKEDEPMTLEEAYEAMGYIKMEKAIKDFEDEFNKKIELPKTLVPFQINLKYGKVEEERSRVVLVFIGENNKNLLKIIASSKTIEQKHNYKLGNGKKVLFLEDNNPDHPTILSLKKGELEYTLILYYQDKKLEKEKIIKIAELF